MKNQMSILTRGLVGGHQGACSSATSSLRASCFSAPKYLVPQHMARQVFFVVIRVLLKGRCKRELIDSRRQVHQGQLRSEAG